MFNMAFFSRYPMWKRNIRRTSHRIKINSVNLKMNYFFKIPPTTILLIDINLFKDVTNNLGKYFFTSVDSRLVCVSDWKYALSWTVILNLASPVICSIKQTKTNLTLIFRWFRKKFFKYLDLDLKNSKGKIPGFPLTMYLLANSSRADFSFSIPWLYSLIARSRALRR